MRKAKLTNGIEIHHAKPEREARMSQGEPS